MHFKQIKNFVKRNPSVIIELVLFILSLIMGSRPSYTNIHQEITIESAIIYSYPEARNPENRFYFDAESVQNRGLCESGEPQTNYHDSGGICEGYSPRGAETRF
jgi:hypothetical protein